MFTSRITFLSSVARSPRRPSPPCPPVKIDFLPEPLYFHTLTHSFALCEMLSPFFSSSSALFSQNTGGGGMRRCTAARKCAPVSPFIATLTDPPSRKSFVCHSYENHRGVGYRGSNFNAQTRHIRHHHFARKPFAINRLRTLSITNRGWGVAHPQSLQVLLQILPVLLRPAKLSALEPSIAPSRSTAPSLRASQALPSEPASIASTCCARMVASRAG